MTGAVGCWHTFFWWAWDVAVTKGLPAVEVYGVGAAVFVVGVVLALLVGRRSGRRALSQRLTALGSRLGIGTPDEHSSLETALSYLEQVTGAATEAVADSSADAIRLRRSLDTFPQGVVLCDENGTVVYRNARANALMASRHGDALAAQAVTELLENAWDAGAAERTLDLYGPPRRTLAVRARLIDDGRRPLGVIAIIEDISERRRLEEIRRDFVANVSHELKTPMGALGLLAETLVAEPDVEVARRLASRIHTEAFRVSRIIDDLLDLSRIESEAAPPREPVLVNLVMAEAVERVRASAEQRAITITLSEPEPPVVVLGDRRQLVSAMHALIENAVTYSYDGSTVTVAAKVTPAGLEAAASPWGGAGATGFTPSPSGVQVASTVIVAPGVATTATPSSFSPAPGVTATPAKPQDGEPSAAGDAGSAPQGGNSGTGADLTNPARANLPAPGGTASHWTAPGTNGVGSGSRAGAPGDEVPGGAPAVLAAGPATPDEPSGAPLHARVAKDTVRISVHDHGVGIPARDLDRIFERFYRVDHGRSRDTGGTGLGLSIVRHVANNHQGWVEVESREGEGSTFTLVLPLQPDRSV
ncbi:MAG TPA: ATP-binding protein [Acidimicrobiales bacterium]|nr:ATP-binding protein [Acidimicrobiales bacterium]